MRSLERRLLLMVVATTTAGFLIAGIIGTRFVASSIEDSFDSRIERIIDTLARTTEVGADGTLELGNVPSAAEFNRQRSGWYWMISRGEQVLARSRSLWTENLPTVSAEPMNARIARGPHGESLRIVTRTVPAEGQQNLLSFSVSAPAHLVRSEVRRAITWLLAPLGLIGLVSVLITAMLVKRGLAPLAQMAQAVGQMSRGEISVIETAGYREIDPLIAALNGMLANVREIATRSRLHVSNLAHALKTPLALLSARMHALGPENDAIAESVDRMNRHINHHLKRVRFSPTASLVVSRIALRPVLEDIVMVMQRMHPRNIHTEVQVDANAAFLAEREDVEELLGNLVENAYKWTRSRIVIASMEREGRAVVTIDDDGPGIDSPARNQVLRPGVRLDEMVDGSGLGLSIATDLTTHYGGTLTLDHSPLGGLKVTVSLP